jgi:hypothetical protein
MNSRILFGDYALIAHHKNFDWFIFCSEIREQENPAALIWF